MIIRFIKDLPLAKTPTAGSRNPAGYDLYAANEKPEKIYPGQTKMIDTGLIIELPTGMFGAIFPRSGLATKQGLRLANCVGVCDPDYRGHYIVALHNDSDEVRTIEPGERIAQLLILPYITAEFVEADSLSETQRGTGGFGSTGQ